MSFINELINELKKTENYVPRDYKTIGGMWTTDTWQKNGVKLQVMDEGYTKVIQSEGLKVVIGYNGKDCIRYELGNEDVVENVLKKIKV